LVAARGAGKTYVAAQLCCFELLLKQTSDLACFMSSSLVQAKQTFCPIMEKLLKHFPEGMVKYKSQEHCYYFQVGSSSKRILLLGYENPESKRGLHPNLLVLDETGSMPHDMFGTIILGMLQPSDENPMGGRLVCIGTARRNSKFREIFDWGLDSSMPEWESYTVKATDSHLFLPEYLEFRRRSMHPDEYNQEYMCDWEADVLYGAVYLDYIKEFAIKNTDSSYDWDPSIPVWVVMDLGMHDSTAIGFLQHRNNVATFIDFYENNGKDMAHYADVLNRKPYTYAECLLPFDGFGDTINGPSVANQLKSFGFRVNKVPRIGEYSGIQKARTFLKTVRFNATKCIPMLEHLKNCTFRINSRTGEKEPNLLSDIHAHTADMFRYVAVSDSLWSRREILKPKVMLPYNSRSGRYAYRV
jgi:hypothetical protein